jgi:hypothetical protein
MIGDVSQPLAGQFAECLAEQLSSRPAAQAEAGPAPAAETRAGEPAAGAATGQPAGAGGQAGDGWTRPAQQRREIGGIRLTLWAVWRAIVRGVRRLAGRTAR